MVSCRLKLPSHRLVVHLVALAYVIILGSHFYQGSLVQKASIGVESKNVTVRGPKDLPKLTKQASLMDDHGLPQRRWINSRLFCRDKRVEPRTERLRTKGRYTVLHNHVLADRGFRCDESVTYATQATYQYMGKLLELLEHWSGPISMSVYAPGADYAFTMKKIASLRRCIEEVRKRVTFHLFFESEFAPAKILSKSIVDIAGRRANCSVNFSRVKSKVTFRHKMNLTYPINVARNVARENAQTHFTLSSDIELVPSQHVPEWFTQMMRRDDDDALKRGLPSIFVLPIFEIRKPYQPPWRKDGLVTMIKMRAAQIFHHHICPRCQWIPGFWPWMKSDLDCMAK